MPPAPLIDRALQASGQWCPWVSRALMAARRFDQLDARVTELTEEDCRVFPAA
jgi:hypothetical protein